MDFKNFWVQYKLGAKAFQESIAADSFVIGRAPECDLPIVSDVVSRRHLKVYFEQGVILLKDLGSTNGTYLKGQLLKPGEIYEYKTGDKLHIDSGHECSIRITPIFESEEQEAGLDIEKAKLEKKKNELKAKSKARKSGANKENYLVSATESVDNIFDNLLFIAKSVRFKKEKEIKEAEHISQEMIEEARHEIEENRALLEKEIKILQQDTKKEARRIINSANAKASQIITKAEEHARLARDEWDAFEKDQKNIIEKERQKVLVEAQERHSEIIAEAHLKNKELKAEIEKLKLEFSDKLQKKQEISDELKRIKENWEERQGHLEKVRMTCAQEDAKLHKLQTRVADLEARNQEAMDVLEVEIPEMEERLRGLKEEQDKTEKACTEHVNRMLKVQEDIKEKEVAFAVAEEKCAKSEERLDALNTKISDAEDNLFRLAELNKKRNEETDKEIAEKKRELKAEVEKTDKKIATRLERAKKEIAEQKKATDKQSKKILKDSEQAAEKIMAEARLQSLNIKEEAENLRKEAALHADQLKKKIEKECLAKKNRFDEELAKAKKDKINEVQANLASMKASAEKESKELIQRAEAKYSTLVEKAEADYAELVERARVAAETTTNKAQARADKLIKEAKATADDIIGRAETDSEDIQQKVQELADEKIKELELEIEERKKLNDEELQKLRTGTVKQLEEQKRRFEAEEAERNHIRVMRLRKELSDVLYARLKPLFKSEEQIDKANTIISKSINAIMLDEIDEDFSQSENYSDIDPSLAQEQVKKFWVYSGGAAALLVLVLLLAPTFKKAAVDKGRDIANSMEKETRQQIDRVKKQNDLTKAFNPTKKEEYLESYTKRVLYTKDYVKTELNPKFREQWIIDLQDFFVHKLRLDENNLVPFIAQEANLIRELEAEMGKINGNFVDQGIERMKEVEEAFIKKIRANIKKKSDFDKIMKFKKDFFEKNKGKF